MGDREVACRPVGTAAWRCRVDAYDLSEVVVFNGGGKASGDAPPDLRAAEEKARMARRGIWRAY
jgi:endonuclease YncB( thermonuclease family)